MLALLNSSLEVELRELARANPAAAFRETASVEWCTGAEPGAIVYRTRLDAATAGRAITERLGAFDAAGFDVTWWAGPSDQPEDLRRHLEAAGFVLEDDEAGMVADLGRLVEDLPVPAGVDFAVTGGDGELDERLIDDWLDVAAVAFGWPAGIREARRRLYLADERRPRPWRHVVARLDGMPVALSRVLVHGGAAMVHGVATLPRARRRGIGSAVTLRALQLARDAGATVGVLQASSMGQGPYRRLGFEHIASYGRYVRPTPGGRTAHRPDSPGGDG